MTKIKTLNDADLELVIGGASKGSTKTSKTRRYQESDDTMLSGNFFRNDPDDRGPYRQR